MMAERHTEQRTEDMVGALELQAESPVPWWQDGPVVYQIYPRSFNDHDAGGEGTLKGVTEKLDYLRDTVGTDALWLTPFYDSPMVDGGYDVASYREVMPRFGTMADFEELVVHAHEHDLKVMVDFVPNHMSTNSAWYQEALADPDSPKNDWFIFRDPAGYDEKSKPIPPNNWLSEFRKRTYDEATGTWLKEAQSAWRYIPEREQFVLCTFTEAQADLNWHNPELRTAMYDELRFLLEKGVDGFRVDMATYIGKHVLMQNEPYNPDFDPAHDDPNNQLLRKYRNSDPSMYGYLQEMVDVVDSYPGERFIVWEDYVERDNPVGHYMSYYQMVDRQNAAPFNFEGFPFMTPHTAAAHTARGDELYKAILPSWVPTAVLGNHDQSRLATRLGSIEAARAAAVAHITLPGHIYVYQGEELGMHDVHVPPDMIDDPYDGRDPCRTPMLWTPGPNAGFTDAAQPWLPISPDYEQVNVETQLKDPNSVLNLYRALITLRHRSRALRQGSYIPENADHADVYAFSRRHGSELLTILRNYSGDPARVNLAKTSGRRILSSMDITMPPESIRLQDIILQANEAVIIAKV